MDSSLLTLGIAAATYLLVLIAYSNQVSRLGTIEKKLNALLAHQGVNPRLQLPLSDRVKELASDLNRNIEAITIYREETGSSLVLAREAVEEFMANQKGSR